MFPRNIDDKVLAWKISLFLLISAFLAVAIDAFRETGKEIIFNNPFFLLVVAAAFLSLLYWLMRNFNISRNRSLAAVAAVAAVLLAISMSGLQAYVVMSNSMQQKDDKTMLHHFWERLNYSEQEFSKFPVSGGFQAGDLLIAIRTDDLRVGDVAADVSGKIPVTHRIFFLNESTVMTVGDASPPFDWRSIQTRDIRQRDAIYGSVLFMIPKAGILKVLYYCRLDPGCSMADCFNEGRCGQIGLYV